MTRVLLLSRYGPLGASSRYRFYQYLPHLRGNDFTVDVAPLLPNDYLEHLYSGRRYPLTRLLATYARRLKDINKSNCYDIIWLEYEALPWLPASVEHALRRGSTPWVIDYDDAIFHRYDQHRSPLLRLMLGDKIDQVMRRAALVVAGNEYLAARARAAGAPYVEVLPTVVDLARYPTEVASDDESFRIGWIGSPQTAHYLREVAQALRPFFERNSNARLVAIGSGPLSLDGIPVDVRPWSEATEVSEIATCHVGIMPLHDTPWERGKCGLKLIQYMAAGRPVIGTPVGVNTRIITPDCGFLATDPEDWISALERLAESPSLRKAMGAAGRSRVEESYCLNVTAPRLQQLFTSVTESSHVRN